jgi:type II secretory pathway component GspD/PulD (secretin)
MRKDILSLSVNVRNLLKEMKLNVSIVTLVGLVACSLAGFAQDTTAVPQDGTAATVAATDGSAQPAASTATSPDAPATATAASTTAADPAVQAEPAGKPASSVETPAAPTTDTPAQPADAKDAAPAPQASANSSAQPATASQASPAAENPEVKAGQVAANDAPQPAAATVAANEAKPAAGASAPSTNATTGGVIPLIVMDDVPLTDAIKNLARQAGLNYVLDPKVGFGQPGPDGKVLNPSVSIRWENVTAEQALTALLKTYNLQMIEDPKTKIALVTAKDPAAPDPLITKIIQLKFANPSNLVANVQGALTDKRSKVMPDIRTSQLVVVATEKEMNAVEEMVASLDTKTKQVLIEARLLETQINPHTDKGVDWTGTLQHQHFVVGNNALPGLAPTPSTTSLDANGNPVTVPGSQGVIGGIVNAPALVASLSKGSFFNPATAFLNADGVAATLSFLNTYAETKVISSPRTVTLDNELAVIEVGTMFPIVNTTAGTANTTGGSSISYSNLTVRLEVTPRISANDFVNLKVAPRIVRLGDLVKSTVGGAVNEVNEFFTRKLDTAVLIPSGNTLVMGGLIEDNVHTENIKVPVLGDIPGLGFMFRHDSKNRIKSNLIVFLTPTIVQDEDYQPTKTDYLKSPVPTSDSIEPDWSAWDSGKPDDWSKPAHK